MEVSLQDPATLALIDGYSSNRFIISRKWSQHIIFSITNVSLTLFGQHYPPNSWSIPVYLDTPDSTNCKNLEVLYTEVDKVDLSSCIPVLRQCDLETLVPLHNVCSYRCICIRLPCNLTVLALTMSKTSDLHISEIYWKVCKLEPN